MWLYNMYPFLGGSSKSDRRTLQRMAQYENNRMWQDIFNRTVCVIANLFEWKNLPKTIDQYFFEMMLLFLGQACIVYDEEFASYICLMCTPAGKMNLYYQNGFYRAYSLGYSKKFMALTSYNKDIFEDLLTPFGGSEGEGTRVTRGVVCQDNPLCYEMVNTIEIYTNRVVSAMRSLDVLQKQAQLPSIIETDEDTKLAIQQAVSDINDNVLAVYVGKGIASALMESKSLQTQFNPAVIDVMWNHLNNLRSEQLTAFGINNLNTADKKERLLRDEINSNNDSIEYNLQYRLDYRKRFCENFNSVFGTNISVDLRHENSVTTVGEPSRGGANGDFKDTSGNT